MASALLGDVLALAGQAAALGRALQARGDLEPRDKGGGEGPVSRADLALDELIVEGLRALAPGDEIISEERPRIAGDRGRVWYVDPIDGTRAYLEGADDWAIHIGLCVDGRPALGVVAEPAAGRVAAAERDGAGWSVLHGPLDRPDLLAPLPPVADPPPRAGLRGVESRHHRSATTDAIARALALAERRACASTGVKICLVARGEIDVYAHPTPYLRPWDTAAPAAILLGAGGSLCTLAGAELVYRGATPHQSGLLGCSPGLLSWALPRLAPFVPAA